MTTSPPPISVQLYSLRKEAAEDFTGVLRRLGAAGFVGVELAGFHDLSPIQVAEVIADCGLTVSSGHLGDLSDDAIHRALDDLQMVGCNTAVLAFLPPDKFSTASDIHRCADAINAANAIAVERQMTFGYHNHWWEFENIIEGSTAWELLFARLDPTVIAELDVYWATVGKVDPVDIIERHRDRIQLLHVKDGPADDPASPMVAVGSGSLDVPAIVGAAAARWHIVELDACATDMFEAVEHSHHYLTGAGLSRGRE